MPGNAPKSNKPYISIIEGNIAQKVDKDTEGAKYREFEPSDKTKGAKWELIFNSWTGTIQNITFKETTFGEMCNIELDDAILSLNTASRYFSDLACKLFNGDIKQKFTFHPYDFEVDGKRKSGISLQQNGVKLKNYFYDGTKNLHDFPEVDKEKSIKKTYWKIYFAEVAEFLIEKIKKLKFAPKVNQGKVEEIEISMDDIPGKPDDGLPF